MEGEGWREREGGNRWRERRRKGGMEGGLKGLDEKVFTTGHTSVQ